MEENKGTDRRRPATGPGPGSDADEPRSFGVGGMHTGRAGDGGVPLMAHFTHPGSSQSSGVDTSDDSLTDSSAHLPHKSPMPPRVRLLHLDPRMAGPGARADPSAAARPTTSHGGVGGVPRSPGPAAYGTSYAPQPAHDPRPVNVQRARPGPGPFPSAGGGRGGQRGPHGAPAQHAAAPQPAAPPAVRPLRVAPVQYRFQRRVGKVNWRALMEVDIDTVLRTGDVTPLRRILNNVAFSVYSTASNEPAICTVQLVRTAQLTIEMLLNEQNHACELLAVADSERAAAERAASAALAERDDALREAKRGREHIQNLLRSLARFQTVLQAGGGGYVEALPALQAELISVATALAHGSGVPPPPLPPTVHHVHHGAHGGALAAPGVAGGDGFTGAPPPHQQQQCGHKQPIGGGVPWTHAQRGTAQGVARVCPHCARTFASHPFLVSHCLRRHPGLPVPAMPAEEVKQVVVQAPAPAPAPRQTTEETLLLQHMYDKLVEQSNAVRGGSCVSACLAVRGRCCLHCGCVACGSLCLAVCLWLWGYAGGVVNRTWTACVESWSSHAVKPSAPTLMRQKTWLASRLRRPMLPTYAPSCSPCKQRYVPCACGRTVGRRAEVAAAVLCACVWRSETRWTRSCMPWSRRSSYCTTACWKTAPTRRSHCGVLRQRRRWSVAC